jgi:hypothetical protein
MMMMIRKVELCVFWIWAEIEVAETVPLIRVEVREDQVVLVKPTWII